MWVKTLGLRDVRNIRSLDVEPGPGLNVFVGESAQAKAARVFAVAAGEVRPA